MYYGRSVQRYPQLLARRQDLWITAEQTSTKSGVQFLMYHSPTNDILIFIKKAVVRLLAQNCPILVPRFLRLIIDEQGKTESVVQQMDDDYTRETGFVRSSAAYGFQE
ncbi:hypothetical protein Tsp_14582 [Trichinella spiralis]|nr:hypothetical protein Tsp_15144 [Trichinella spiralis]XP_003370557.1 hypothetical protein Tsp_14582 [Trichinella spiralis]